MRGGLAVGGGLRGVVDHEGDLVGTLLCQQGQGLAEQLAAQATAAVGEQGLDPVNGSGAIGSYADHGFRDRLGSLADDQSVTLREVAGENVGDQLRGRGLDG
nr:hypothetical protein [Streptomyces sp. RLB1-33]